MTGSRWTAALTGALGVIAAAGTAVAAEPAAAPSVPTSAGDRATGDEPSRKRPFGTDVHGPAGRRNAVVLAAQAKVPDWGTSLAYQRAFGKRFSLGAGVEYGYQAVGYWHLQGVGESLSGQLWVGRPFHGVFAEGSMTLAHQFLTRQPRLSTIALVPGMALGFRWTHKSGLTLGASAGLRWGRVVSNSDLVCTRAKYCNSVRQGAYTRLTADIGYVFGSRRHRALAQR